MKPPVIARYTRSRPVGKPILHVSHSLDERLGSDLRNNVKFPWAYKDGYFKVYIIKPLDISENDFHSYLEKNSVQILTEIKHDVIVARIPENKINVLSQSNLVQYITQISGPKKSHLDKIRPTVNYIPGVFNLLGSGVKFGIWDNASVDTNHVDFISPIYQIDNTSISQHATHVAGIIISNGTLSNGRYRGFVPLATTYSYDFDSIGPVANEVETAQSSYNISLSHNSWGIDILLEGCDKLGLYEVEGRTYDDLIRTSGSAKSITTIFSIGNERAYNYCDQLNRPYNTTTPPATAKNVISVGAANSIDRTITFFSSWGPTDDGRLKPDIVAPGCTKTDSIISTFPNNTYGGLCGTSQAAPVVSGVAALMLEQYRLNFSRDPLSSTIKGILIHTATDLDNEGDGGDNNLDGPDFTQGYGLVNAQKAIEQVRKKWLTEGLISTTGENKTYYTKLDTGNDILKITLVWDDLPGDPSSSGKQLKNDLDLIVYDNNSVRVFPWTLDPNNPSLPATQNKEDHLNNVEQVFKGNNSVGVWTIIVNATNLTSSQNFSLILDNFYDPNPPSSPTIWASPKKVGKNISVFWLDAKDQETGIAEYQYQFDNTTNASYISVGQSLRFSITNTIQGKHTVFVRALDYFGNPSVPGNTTFVFDSVAPTQANLIANFVTPVSATIDVDTNENATAHVEYGTTTSYGTISGAEEFRQHQSVALTGLSVNTLYHYRVKSTDEAGNNISSADNTFTTTNSSNIVNSFGGSLTPFTTSSPFVNVTLNRPGQWDLNWDISGQNATLNVYDPAGALFASKTAPPSTTRFYLDNNMLGIYTMQVTYFPGVNQTLRWSISSTLTQWTTPYNYEYNDNFKEKEKLD